MQANDVRVLKSAAIPTVIVGLVVAVVSAVVAGAEGALAAFAGVAVVFAFFIASLVAVTYAGRISPTMMMAAALGTYVVKLVVLFVLLSLLSGVTVWHPTAFAVTVILCTVAWTAGETRGFLKLRMLYVEPGTKVPGRVDK